MMLKRATHIILSFLLLFSTTGITVARHYCGGHLKSVSLITEPVSCCDTEGCCHNDSEVYKVHDDFAVSSINIDFELVISVSPAVIAMNSFESEPAAGQYIYSDRPSPPGVRLFLSSIQTFRL